MAAKRPPMSKEEAVKLARAYALSLKARGIASFRNCDLVENVNCHSALAAYLTRDVVTARLGTQLFYNVSSFLAKKFGDEK